MLIDPVWAERASPFSFVGPKRVNAPGIAFDDLPKIDAVLVTHNHYDHMDVETIGRLWQRFRPRIVTPLGNDAILKARRAGPRRRARSTGTTTVDLGDGLVVHAEPTLHWSARGAGDRMHALWASFVRAGGRQEDLLRRRHRLRRRRHLRARPRTPSRSRAGAPADRRLRAALVHAQQPHEPRRGRARRWQLCGAAQALGHHWGTFRLTNEGVDAPLRDLEVARVERAIVHERFPALQPGAVHVVG